MGEIDWETIARWPVLPRAFYERGTVQVARDLLGKVILHGRTAGRIVETEAYLGAGDLAAHASRGVTPRTRVIFGPPGRAYVYLIYGIHECLNLIAEPDGTPGCVLIRALQPLSGLPLMRRRRGVVRLSELAGGPGKLTQAMAITRGHNGRDVTAGSLTVRSDPHQRSFEIAVSGRIGVTKCADWPLRFRAGD